MGTLLLRFAGPMQSWGSGSLFDRRDTEPYPTKSGTLGILAASLGRKRGDSLDDLRKLRFGVRVDAPGTQMADFQITEMKSETGKRYNSNLSQRYYLSDAVFLVGLESDDEKILKEYMIALMNPVYAPFLGRKSCPPVGQLVLGIRKGRLEEVLNEAEWLMPEWRQKDILRDKDVFLRILVEDPAAATTIRDNPISYSSLRREYGYRGIREEKPKVINAPKKSEDIYSSSLDPMDELTEGSIYDSDLDVMAEL